MKKTNIKTIIAGQVSIFQRPETQSNYFYVEFLDPNKRAKDKRVVKSLKTRNYEQAHEKARTLYYEAQHRIKEGLPVGELDLEACCKILLRNSYGTKKDTINWLYKNYWSKFPIFRRAKLSSLTADDISEYLHWRIDQQILYANTRQRKNHISTQKVSKATIKADLGTLKQVLNIAVQQGTLRVVPQFPRTLGLEHKNSKVIQQTSTKSRGVFTEEDLRTLGGALSKIRENLKDDLYAPRKRYLEKPWDEYGNRWVSARRKYDACKPFKRTIGDLFKENPNVVDTLDRAAYSHRSKRLSACYFMVLMTLTLNCGIRPVEIKKIRFKDITRTGGVCKVRISELIAKTRKERDAICWDAEEVDTAIQIIRDELHKHFNVEITEDHFVFPSYRNINQHADRFVQNVVKRHLRYLNLWTSDQPDRDTGERLFTPKTLYSARATYITKLVRERVDLYVIAQNAGTSIAMIEKYYSKAKTTDFIDQLVASERPETKRTEGRNTNATKPRSK